MDEKRAREILKSVISRQGNNLYALGWYVSWDAKDVNATLDGRFTIDELEAIAWWMRNKKL